MGVTNLLLTIIAVLLIAVYMRAVPLETDRALAHTYTGGRYQIAAAGDTAPKGYIVDTVEGKVWIVDTARIIKSFDLLRDL
ncbi:MAG: hypothetical protein ACE5IC_09755 [Candidatus Brocadiales bacterium]